MLICRNRDEMKRHLLARVEILTRQKETAEHRTGRKQYDTAAQIEGLKEALQLIDAWEHSDSMAGVEDSIMEELACQ